MKKKRHQKLTYPIQKFLIAVFFALTLLCSFWTVESITETRQPQSLQPTELYANQNKDDLRLTLTTAIHNAKKSILLIIYTLTDEKIIQSLRQKSIEGIDVRVICDAKGSPLAARKLGSKVKTFKRFSSGIMHQKILVVDEEQVWIGSANMTGESLRLHGNLIMAMHSKELAAMIARKAQAFKKNARGELFSHQNFTICQQKSEFWLLPDDPQAIPRLLQLIRSAEKTIRVAMFTWTRFDLAQAVIDAKNRGIDTEVAIDYNSAKGASAKVVEMLKKAGVAVRLGPGNALLHHKFLYVDNKTLVNGSANWTKAAFSKNDDCFMVLHDLTEKQKEHLNRLWQQIQAEAHLSL